MTKIHRGTITRGKSSLRKVADSFRGLHSDIDVALNEGDILAMVINHPRSGDRSARSFLKLLVRKVADT